MRVAISIDPGCSTMGVCVWDMSSWDANKLRPPVEALAVNLNKGGFLREQTNSGGMYNYLSGTRELIKRLKRIAARYAKVDRVYCEEMESFGGVRGNAAGGDVLHVAFACGAFYQWASELGAGFHPVRVTEWKGNLSKEQVYRRILKRFDLTEHSEEEERTFAGILTYPISHDWDACGIGLFAQGRFG